MSDGPPRVGIVVAAHDELTRAATVAALRRLGADVRIELAGSDDEALDRVREISADLLIRDHASAQRLGTLIEGLRPSDPPVVVIVPAGQDRLAVKAFREGAADCVTRSDDYDEVLPVVALEQVRRHRAARDRSRAERRLRDLEELNEHIIQNMNSALVVLDTEGRIAFCNPTAETILGVPAGELSGRPAWTLFPNTPRERVLFSRTLDEGVRYRGEETVITRPDGTLVPIGVSCAPLAGSEGQRLGAVAIFQDLSEVKELQQQVLQTEKMASIGQLAAGVAHEINNPMGFIHANLFQMTEYLGDLRRLWEHVEALQQAAADGKPDALRDAAEALEKLAREVDARFLIGDLENAVRESLEGSERIRHIVRDLREFSHQGGDDRELADLNQCLDSTANIVWSMMKHAAVLERDYGTIPPVLCYPMQLKQVFMNLLVNAYQAIRERGEDDRGEIRLRTRVEGDTAVVVVEDNGIGITSEQRDRIFDPFFTTKEVGVGTGLGLSTAFNIVRRHGGTIHVESRPGGGATFEVALPLRAPEPAA
ncbi:MAG: PAS domain S-box protein [Deltaproteobacteria bacterium]|nr:MAG: PAS domain S-box protein [Deltaproteobacteria bacterium]